MSERAARQTAEGLSSEVVVVAAGVMSEVVAAVEWSPEAVTAAESSPEAVTAELEVPGHKAVEIRAVDS